MAKYFSKHANLHLHLRPTRTIIADNRPVDVRGISMIFVDHKVDTSRMHEGKEAEKLMDAWIEANSRRDTVHKIPSDEEIKKVVALEKKVAKAKKKALAEVMEKHEGAAEAIKGQEDFDAFVSKAKASKLVQGMRGTG